MRIDNRVLKGWDSSFRKKAEEYLAKASKTISAATQREKLYYNACQSWMSGDILGAISAHEQISDLFPTDIFSAWVANVHCLYTGSQDRMLALMRKVFDENKYITYGLRAFAEEELNNFKVAEDLGKKGTSMAPDKCHPWAHHAVCHVMDSCGRVDEGIEWMESLTHTWEGCNSFMYTHNWWHMSLLYMEKELLDEKKVMEIYNGKIWGEKDWHADPEVIANAVGLLWRLELRTGSPVSLWENLSDSIAPKIKQHVQPFLDLHYCYALARAGKTERLNELRTSMIEHYGSKNNHVLGDKIVPVGDAIMAHASGNFEDAYTNFKLCGPGDVLSIGGSNAQRRPFEMTLVDVLIKTGRYEEALPILLDRGKIETNPVATTKKALDIIHKNMP